MIVTLDTNFLTSGLVAIEGGTIARIIEAWRAGRFDVALSDHLYSELEESLSKSYFTDRVPAASITRYLAFVRSHATFYMLTAVVAGVATHPEDDLVLAAAVSAGAAYLVTGDRRFRTRVPSFQGVQLVSPAEFVGILDAAPNAG